MQFGWIEAFTSGEERRLPRELRPSIITRRERIFEVLDPQERTDTSAWMIGLIHSGPDPADAKSAMADHSSDTGSLVSTSSSTLYRPGSPHSIGISYSAPNRQA